MAVQTAKQVIAENLAEHFDRPFHNMAATALVTALDSAGFVIRPKEPTLAMLRAGHAALCRLYPQTQEAKVGQYIVYESMIDAYASGDQK